MSQRTPRQENTAPGSPAEGVVVHPRRFCALEKAVPLEKVVPLETKPAKAAKKERVVAERGSLVIKEIREFEEASSCCSRGHSFCRHTVWHRVFCFSERADAERFGIVIAQEADRRVLISTLQ